MPLHSLSHFLVLDSQLLGAIVLFRAIVALALFVIANSPHTSVNRRFGIMALTTAGWILTISLALATTQPRYTVLLGRVGFAFASGIPFSLVWMVDSVSDPRRRTRFAQLLTFGILCAVFAAASFSPYVLADAKPSLPRTAFVYGPLHRFFGIYFFACFASGIYTLYSTIKSASGIDRLQLRYLILGISLTGLGAMTTNLLIPLIWRTSRYSFLGPYFSLLFFSFSAHAIIRHRLMDIRVVIRQGVVYFSAILTSAMLFLLAAEFLRRLAGYDQDHVPLFEALVVATALAIFFQPLKNSLQRWLNRYLYRETYDYQRTVRAASRQLSTMLELEPLLDYLNRVIKTTFQAETVTIYLNDQDRGVFLHRSSRETPQGNRPAHELSYRSPLVTFLQPPRGTLVREEAARQSADHLGLAAAQTLQQLGGDLAFSLNDEHITLGVMVVGPKRSGDPYFAEDIDLLETLTGQAAVAMKNAHLYRQVVLVNEYVDNILSTMESGVIAITAEGHISILNPAAERLTGLTARALHDVSYLTLPAAFVSPLREALDDLVPRSQFEMLIQGSDGTTLPLVCSTAVLRHRGGTTHGALIVFSDLTRLKHLEREKRRAERLASFGALASGVAHEIKNPLVAIRTFAELLPERFTDTDFREDFAKVVIREIARIDDLVGRLRGIAATAPHKVGTIDLREPLTDTLALLRAQLEQTRTTVHSTFHDPAPFVMVDEAQLKQLFLNLFLNALEAMGHGGTMSIQLLRKTSQDSQWIVVEVSDTGPGIPDALKASIFDPFFTTKPRGSGLGLAICRGITDAHRGTIRAESRAGRGTTMIVEFPAGASASILTEQGALLG